MHIKLQLNNACRNDSEHCYADIKQAYRDGIKYVEKHNKESCFAIARVRIYTDEHLDGEIFISSRFSGKRHKNGRAIPCKEGYDVCFVDFWASTEKTRQEVNKLFDEVR